MNSPDPFRTPSADVAVQRTRNATPGTALLHGPRKVRAARGANWMTDGFALVGSGAAGWLLAAVMISLPGVLTALLSVYFLDHHLLLQSVLSLLTTPLIVVIWGAVMYACYHAPFRIARVIEGIKLRWRELFVLGLALTLIGFAVGAIISLVSDPTVLQNTTNVDDLELLNNLLRIMLVVLVIGTPVMMAVWFAPALVAVTQVPTLTALKLSFRASLINVLPFFVFSLLAIALLAVGVVLLAIVSGIILGLTGMLARFGASAGGVQPVMLLVMLLNFVFTFIFFAVTWAAQYAAFDDVFLRTDQDRD